MEILVELIKVTERIKILKLKIDIKIY